MKAKHFANSSQPAPAWRGGRPVKQAFEQIDINGAAAAEAECRMPNVTMTGQK